MHSRLVNCDFRQFGLPVAGLYANALHRWSCGRRLQSARISLIARSNASSALAYHLCLLQGSECRMPGEFRGKLLDVGEVLRPSLAVTRCV